MYFFRYTKLHSNYESLKTNYNDTLLEIERLKGLLFEEKEPFGDQVYFFIEADFAVYFYDLINQSSSVYDSNNLKILLHFLK